MMIRCQCGEVLGDRCANDAETSIWWVPNHRRGTAEALGNARGMWDEILVSHDCADLLCDGDEWFSSEVQS